VTGSPRKFRSVLFPPSPVGDRLMVPLLEVDFVGGPQIDSGIQH